MTKDRIGSGVIRAAAIAIAISGVACSSSSSSSSSPKLQSDWMYITSDGNSGTALDIKDDGSYVIARLTATTANSFDAQEEIGTISVAGNSITFTPASSSCRYAEDEPYTATFDITGSELSMALNFGVVVFELNTATNTGSASGALLTNGCFQDDESFVPSSISPIGSCVVDTGTTCSATAPCCRGLTCGTDGVCAGTCTQNTDCKSGCCPVTKDSEGLRGCAPASECK